MTLPKLNLVFPRVMVAKCALEMDGLMRYQILKLGILSSSLVLIMPENVVTSSQTAQTLMTLHKVIMLLQAGKHQL